MPVHVEVRMVRLTFGFEQRRGILQKRHADCVRTCCYRNARVQMGIYDAEVLVRGRLHREQSDAPAIQQQLQLVRSVQAFNFLVAVARQADLELVFTVLRKGVPNQRSTAGADWQSWDVFLLGENESTYVPMGTKHRLENSGMVDVHIIEVQWGSYLGEDDIIRFEDTYGRSSDD